MKIILYSTKDFEKAFYQEANEMGHELTFVPEALDIYSAVLAAGEDVVSVFTADDVSAPVIEQLHRYGIRYIAIRAAGYDNVDIEKAVELGIKVANVPAYSPYAIAEHAIALMLALNRKLVIADRQVHRFDFRVDNLIGFDLHRKTVGVIGTGRIGSVVAHILHGFGCNLLGYDIVENEVLAGNYNLAYTDLKTLCAYSDIITIHTPLNKATRHMINKEVIESMKQGVILINTARGAVIDTGAVAEAVVKGRIGGLGMDVYEKERGLFFYNHSGTGMEDQMLRKLLNYTNVIITPHQGFATREALNNITAGTFYNINCWIDKRNSSNELPAGPVKPVVYDEEEEL